MSQEEAQAMIRQYEGRRPPSLDLFLDYVGLTEDEFYAIATGHQVSPWQFDSSAIREGKTTPILASGFGEMDSILLRPGRR